MDYRHTYIFLTYLPGAGGNFFSRCLNLLQPAYCWANKETKHIPCNLDEKIQLLNYESVLGKSFPEIDWIKFEFHSICHYSEIQPHPSVPDGSYVIWPEHGKAREVLQSSGNRNIKLYLDVSEAYEWCIMNCIYKNSSIIPWTLWNDVELLNDNSVRKVSVKNIVTGVNEFVEEFQKVCAIFDHVLSPTELTAITGLYLQWQQTMLPIDQINDFKKKIGWRL